MDKDSGPTRFRCHFKQLGGVAKKNTREVLYGERTLIAWYVIEVRSISTSKVAGCRVLEVIDVARNAHEAGKPPVSRAFYG